MQALSLHGLRISRASLLRQCCFKALALKWIVTGGSVCQAIHVHNGGTQAELVINSETRGIL